MSDTLFKNIKTRWDKALQEGLFNYNLDQVLTRRTTDTRKYIIQLNSARFSSRRQPQAISKVSEPFNPTLFNFLKVPANEILLELSIIIGADGSCHMIDRNSDDCSCDSTTKLIACDVLINISPLEDCHILVVPERHSCHNQVLSEDAIYVAVAVVVHSPLNYRVVYNSLGALASVNHLHLHGFFLEQALYLETCDVKILHNRCYELSDWPVPALAFQLHGNHLNDLCRIMGCIISHLVSEGIAHNLLVTRGSRFDDSNKDDLSTVRIFLWLRKSKFDTEPASDFNVAAFELSGVIICGDEHVYQSMTEEKVTDRLMRERLSNQNYAKVKQDIITLLKNM